MAGVNGNGSLSGPTTRQSTGKAIGLALAGGGPGGAIYEIGALRALEEVLEGASLNDLDIYVGVSAGAFVGANLANQLTPSQMCRAIIKSEPGEHPFTPETFFTPAVGELLRRTLMVPGLFSEALVDYFREPGEITLRESLTRLARALPTAVFDNEPIRGYLENIYSLKGRTDDFRQLGRRLYVVASDLDSGEAVRFGDEGLEHVPISKAVQASSALPGLYPPVEIDGRYYVDGVLLKTLHASVALEKGAQLVLCINPIVPVDTVSAVERGIMRRGKLIDRGLPTVLSQTFRTLIHSRLEAGMARYEGRFKGADIVLLEPKRDDYRMFFRNIFSFRGRRELCEHAYESTRRQLLERYEELQPVLERHGVGLNREVLEDESRTLWPGVGLPEHPTLSAAKAAAHKALPAPPAVPHREPRPAAARSEASPQVVHDLDHLLQRLENLVETTTH
ncbi:MAG: patatin-like phospholipase family protein [Acidobacteriota bacterium]|nr:patatin-like phospholipase family protein [Acidobacteriota bacterium]